MMAKAISNNTIDIIDIPETVTNIIKYDFLCVEFAAVIAVFTTAFDGNVKIIEAKATPLVKASIFAPIGTKYSLITGNAIPSPPVPEPHMPPNIAVIRTEIIIGLPPVSVTILIIFLKASVD